VLILDSVHRLLKSMAIAVLALALAVPAAAARRSVPPDFFGMNWDDEIASTSAPPGLQDQQFARMAAAGVETVRGQFVWAEAQPDGPGPVDFTNTDRFVGLAAAHRITVLPVVIVAPDWERAFDEYFSPPSSPGDYAAYLTALVHRYGSHGSFWDENPRLPRMAIHAWQIWNEPSLNYQWTVQQSEDWAVRYSALVRASYVAIHKADRAGKLVLAGLANNSPALLGHLFNYDIKGFYDVAALHPYTATARGVLVLARRARAIMNRHGGRHAQIWVTELGLPASRGKADSTNSLQTTDAGMARFLNDGYNGLAQQSRKLGIARVYWYTWASSYAPDAGPSIFDYSGLFSWDGSDAPRQQPAYSYYVRAARHYEGCKKTSAGLCAR
jgi:hypothetical protein